MKGDQIVFIQGAEPISLYCADESDGETFRVCGQITEGLYGYEISPVLSARRKRKPYRTATPCNIPQVAAAVIGSASSAPMNIAFLDEHRR